MTSISKHRWVNKIKKQSRKNSKKRSTHPASLLGDRTTVLPSTNRYLPTTSTSPKKTYNSSRDPHMIHRFPGRPIFPVADQPPPKAKKGKRPSRTSPEPERLEGSYFGHHAHTARTTALLGSGWKPSRGRKAIRLVGGIVIAWLQELKPALFKAIRGYPVSRHPLNFSVNFLKIWEGLPP